MTWNVLYFSILSLKMPIDNYWQWLLIVSISVEFVLRLCFMHIKDFRDYCTGFQKNIYIFFSGFITFFSKNVFDRLIRNVVHRKQTSCIECFKNRHQIGSNKNKSDLPDHKTYVIVSVSGALQSTVELYNVVQRHRIFLLEIPHLFEKRFPLSFFSNKLIILLVACYFCSLGHVCDLQSLLFQNLIFNYISCSWFCNMHWLHRLESEYFRGYFWYYDI